MDPEQRTVTFTVDGRSVTGTAGESLLEALRRHGCEVPSLCHHEAVKSYGACRLCLVEVTKHGRTKLTTSCNYPVQEGIAVSLDTPDVVRHRKVILQLLLARAPAAAPVRELAARYGVTETPFEVNEGNACILCGLCVRVCAEVVGAEAVGFAGRGTERKVVPPYDESNEVCMACGACGFICPTGAIQIKQSEGVRAISPWRREAVVQRCAACGRAIAPVGQIEAFTRQTGLPRERFSLCVDCRNGTHTGSEPRPGAASQA